MKKPTSVIRRRAWVFLFDLSGRLVQAMAVRRHGCSMMMVVAVMAEALHLLSKYGESPFGVKWFVKPDTGTRERRTQACAYTRSFAATTWIYCRAHDEGLSGRALRCMDRAVRSLVCCAGLGLDATRSRRRILFRDRIRRAAASALRPVSPPSPPSAC